MKLLNSFLIFVAAGILVPLFSGCLFKPTAASPRRFVLSPVASSSGHSDTNRALSIGVAPIKMPPHLLRNSLLTRKGTNELVYNEEALWAEPLDQGLQRILAANLAKLLPTRQVYLSAGDSSQIQARVFVEVIQMDVDSEGKGTLIAWWRISSPGTDKPLRSGQANFTREGSSPNQPESIAQTLSELAADLSRTIADAIRDGLAQAKDKS